MGRFLAGKAKDSIFKVPEALDGRVRAGSKPVKLVLAVAIPTQAHRLHFDLVEAFLSRTKWSRKLLHALMIVELD